MKICHIISSLDIGGAQKILIQLCGSLNKPDFNHFVINLGEDTQLAKSMRDKGITVYSLSITSILKLIVNFFKLLKVLRHEKPDVVQTWLYHADLIGGIAAKVVGVKNIVWSIHHANPDFKTEKTTTKYLIKIAALLSKRVCSGIIYCSDYAKNVHEKYGYHPQRSFVINNSVDLKEFYPSESLKDKFRKQMRVDDDVFLVGMVARYSPIKGYDIFLRMASILEECELNIEFMLIGTNTTPENIELNNILRNYNLNESTHLMGECKDINRVMNGLDILVCPSYSESFGLVVIEALACCTPVVCSDLGALHNIVNRQYMVSVGDAVGFAKIVQSLLHTSLDERRSVGNEGRSRVLDNYSLKNMVNEYSSVYKELVL